MTEFIAALNTLTLPGAVAFAGVVIAVAIALK